MTTPDTSAVRAWARENGYEVADRGRLPAEVTDAYLAAAPPKPAKKATKPAARKAPAKKAAKPAAPEQAPEPAPESAEEQPAESEQPVAATAERDPRPKPSVVSDDRRLVALGEEIAALVKRVEALEQSSRSSGGGTGKSGLFRRRS